ncbi:hypothetical protein PsorP6_002510 [Peronosclerospora sorghi]|uniref:Uncharacterized protein n=1 Tax=Peronosclerospora sorghi TaxID=230839 RepID=A0ACC0WSH4_9STRA|nr:hypothetical protein PsorP6_002510 [Peronosclerospora sorghi]
MVGAHVDSIPRESMRAVALFPDTGGAFFLPRAVAAVPEALAQMVFAETPLYTAYEAAALQACQEEAPINKLLQLAIPALLSMVAQGFRNTLHQVQEQGSELRWRLDENTRDLKTTRQVVDDSFLDVCQL